MYNLEPFNFSCRSWDFKERNIICFQLFMYLLTLGGYQILNVHPYGRILFCIELAIDSLGFLHFDLEEAF